MKQGIPKIPVSDYLNKFISKQLTKNYSREDYRELLSLTALIIGLDIKLTIRKPGTLHRARWMVKAIYSLKIKLLFKGNEDVLHLTARKLLGLQQFDQFVVCVYIQS